MRSVITLYRSHDEDLLSLYETVGLREFGRLLKESLRILARPGYKPKHTPPSELLPYTGLKDSVRLGLTVIAEKDADIDELLSHVKNRRLGAFCKMALRFYLGPREVMASMLDIELVPVLSYVPTGYIVASMTQLVVQRSKIATGRLKEPPALVPTLRPADETAAIRERADIKESENEEPIDTETTALPTQIIPLQSLNMTMGDTVVMTEDANVDEDEFLALLEGVM